MLACPKCNRLIIFSMMFSKNTHSCTKVIICPHCKAVYKIDLVEMEPCTISQAPTPTPIQK